MILRSSAVRISRLLMPRCPAAARAAKTVQRRSRRPPEAATFSASTQLVIETVTVNDKDGKPIENLEAEDFTVTEDGKPQTIKFFEYRNCPKP